MADYKLHRKWRQEVLRSGLSATAKVVALTIAEYMDPDGYASPGFTRIMDEAGGLSRSTVIRATKELEREGAMEITRRGPGRGKKHTNLYLAALADPILPSMPPFDGAAHRAKKVSSRSRKGVSCEQEKVSAATPEEVSEEVSLEEGAARRPKIKDDQHLEAVA